MGRTQLQDAVPMTLGQEFSTYAVMLEEDQLRLRRFPRRCRRDSKSPAWRSRLSSPGQNPNPASRKIPESDARAKSDETPELPACARFLAPRTRIERATYPLGGGCSIH